ncbi:nickel-dependent hydrogenase large subunit [Desulfurispira natronophila]|uniref:Ni,Fe-hydrogenase I large subunit n=1 Tax=Desulfurispira natronophila TaxID=682562 RepID=A0A7W7Y4M8_9BACT|nr:nickel-dependent hydrogenase large subunit [Desulfurispira natronophila]MBB5021998.1 Ni,Fe-hydrogenase I large subunit [Desulfurispira natronophila]
MSTKIVIDPVTRVEGHLRVETTMDGNRVQSARCSGDMFRGLEKALKGYDARTAQQITQRVCGVCPYAHAETAALALEDAMGIRPEPNGQLLRNLTVGTYQIKDFLLHFYTLCALDFIDITAVLGYEGRDAGLQQVRGWVQQELANNKVFPAAPFLPRYEADYCTDQAANISAIKGYLDAIPIMADFHKMVAIFGGKSPHPVAIEAGGVTTPPTLDRIAHFRTLLATCAPFVREQYTQDVIAVAQAFPGYFREGRGYGNMLSYPYLPDANGDNFFFAGGVTIDGEYRALELDKITEDHTYAYYYDNSSPLLRPLQTDTLRPLSSVDFQAQQSRSDGKYSWGRAPRYDGLPMEVGPAARIINTYKSGTNSELNALVNRFNRQLDITIDDYASVMGRHLSRAILANLTLNHMERQLEMLQPGKPAFSEHPVPRNARGVGITEATRGSLSHYIETDSRGLIRNYEMIVPTTWNMSPRDGSGNQGPVEQMLQNTVVADAANPMELARIVRSTDPCIGCSVH